MIKAISYGVFLLMMSACSSEHTCDVYTTNTSHAYRIQCVVNKNRELVLLINNVEAIKEKWDGINQPFYLGDYNGKPVIVSCAKEYVSNIDNSSGCKINIGKDHVGNFVVTE